MGTAASLERAIPGPKDDRPGVLVKTPYLPAFNDDLKNLPRIDRYWSDELEGWWVAEEHAGTVEELLLRHFGSYLFVTDWGEYTVNRYGRSD